MGLRELESKASTARREERWADALSLYEDILALELGALDRAKCLANAMQMRDKLGDVSGAIWAAEQALEIVERYALYQTNEGAHLRGYVTGALARFRGEPLPPRPHGKLPLATFWYGVTFLAGLYWGISFKVAHSDLHLHFLCLQSFASVPLS
jgi:hypothetical protein